MVKIYLTIYKMQFLKEEEEKKELAHCSAA